MDLRRGAEDGRSDLETPNDGDIDDGGEVSASASFSDSTFAIPGTIGELSYDAGASPARVFCAPVVRDNNKVTRAVFIRINPEVPRRFSDYDTRGRRYKYVSRTCKCIDCAGCKVAGVEESREQLCII